MESIKKSYNTDDPVKVMHHHHHMIIMYVMGSSALCSLHTFQATNEHGLNKNMSSIHVNQAYCNAHSSPLHPVQQKLLEETVQHRRGGMMGAPEVVNMNALLVRSLAAKKVLDIGVFTGASSLAAALAMPSDGLVVACDVSEEFTNMAKGYWKEAGVENKVGQG